MSGSGRGRDATNRGLRSARILLAVLLVTGAAACSSDDEAAPAATTSPPVPEAGEPVTVGDLELTPCEDLEDIWCDTIEVPQDREDDSSDQTLTVGFEWYPRPDPGPAEGLLVAMEGGGRHRSNGEGTRVVLTNVRFTEGLAVSGSVDANDEDRLQEGSTVSVDVTLDDGTTADLSWTLGGLGDAVTVAGTVDGRDVEAQARYA